jgi:NADH dehydrogenase
VTLVDKNNYHLFQPLLYQVASAGLSPDEIARPVRAIIENEGNADFHFGEVTSIDFTAKQVQTALGAVPYDYLVLAVGSDNNFFGMQDVAENSLTLKSIPDALSIRNQLLRQFELASLETDPAIRRRLLTFVIVGGGPTGIESAGALSELFLNVLKKDYPRLDFSEVRIILLEASDRLLSMMPVEQGEYAGKILRKHNVDVRCGAVVSDYDGETVTLKNGETIETGALIWAAGVRANPMLDRLGLKQDRSGRVIVNSTLQVPDHPEIFVIGDAASFPGPDGKPLPMVAPVAIQQAKIVVDNIMKLVQGQPLNAFEYHDPGILATIGRHHAVAYISGIKFRGYLAWLVWLVVHIMQLIGFRNRVVVLVDWAWQYIFYDRALRLIEQPLALKDLPKFIHKD